MTGVGGGTDFVARIIAQGLTSSLGQQVKSVKELVALAKARPGIIT